MEEIIEKVKTGSWSFTPAPAWALISEGAKDMVACMLRVGHALSCCWGPCSVARGPPKT